MPHDNWHWIEKRQGKYRQTTLTFSNIGGTQESYIQSQDPHAPLNPNLRQDSPASDANAIDITTSLRWGDSKLEITLPPPG